MKIKKHTYETIQWWPSGRASVRIHKHVKNELKKCVTMQSGAKWSVHTLRRYIKAHFSLFFIQACPNFFRHLCIYKQYNFLFCTYKHSCTILTYLTDHSSDHFMKWTNRYMKNGLCNRETELLRRVLVNTSLKLTYQLDLYRVN